MSGVMPPEPPPLTGESDYLSGNTKRQVAVVTGTQDVGVFGLDLPIPKHLLDRQATPALNKAVSAVLAASDESIPKRGYNKFHQYAYATADDIRLHIAHMLGAQGLSYEQHEVGYTPFGSLIAVHYYFVLAHESGETSPPQRVTVLTQMISNKGAPDDKAFSKATVLALKDWSKGKFSIATGDMMEDPDSDDRPYPPMPSNQPTQHRPAPRQQSAGNAFADRGTTKVSNGSKPPEQAGNTDAWSAGAVQALEDENDGAKWEVHLGKILAACDTLGRLETIKRAPSVVSALKNAPDKIKKGIEKMFSEATVRLSEVIQESAPDVEHADEKEEQHAG